MEIERRERRIIEQMLSNEHHIYSVEDEMFLYYCNENRFHVVKGNLDYSMDREGWEDFAQRLMNVSDEYFVTGHGKKFKQESGFLGGYLAKYTRRKNFCNGLLDIIEDSRAWNYAV